MLKSTRSVKYMNWWSVYSSPVSVVSLSSLWTVVIVSFTRLLSACRYMRQRTKCTQRLCSYCHLSQCPTNNITSRSWSHWIHCCQWQSIFTSRTMGHSPHRPAWKWSPGLNSSNPFYCPIIRSVISCGQSFWFSVAQYIHVLPLGIICENRCTNDATRASDICEFNFRSAFYRIRGQSVFV